MLQVKARRLKQLHWDKIKTPQQGTIWAKDQPQVNLNLVELENLFQVDPSCKVHNSVEVCGYVQVSLTLTEVRTYPRRTHLPIGSTLSLRSQVQCIVASRHTIAALT